MVVGTRHYSLSLSILPFLLLFFHKKSCANVIRELYAYNMRLHYTCTFTVSEQNFHNRTVPKPNANILFRMGGRRFVRNVVKTTHFEGFVNGLWCRCCGGDGGRVGKMLLPPVSSLMALGLNSYRLRVPFCDQVIGKKLMFRSYFFTIW